MAKPFSNLRNKMPVKAQQASITAVTKTLSSDKKKFDSLFSKVSNHIDHARETVLRTVDSEMVRAYWLIGYEIVKEEQKGKEKAEYGSYLIEELSNRLNKKYTKGFGVSTLKDIRQFYITYSDYSPIGHAVRGRSKQKQFSQNLGWIHYRALMRINRPEARQFYTIEAERNNWSGRELERQIASLLFDRLSKSKDKNGLLKLASEGQGVNNPIDAIKEPLILEFLNIPESHRLVESKLEDALIDNLQQFLLELGKGFAFVARQKRLTLDGDHFYADLVMYHIFLKSYVLIDLKTKKLSHSDIGQMQLYVNYFDQEVKMDNDNPTIGLILCTEKNDAVVKYLLGEKTNQVFAKKYQFHLPTEAELKKELKREIKAIQHDIKKND